MLSSAVPPGTMSLSIAAKLGQELEPCLLVTILNSLLLHGGGARPELFYYLALFPPHRARVHINTEPG